MRQARVASVVCTAATVALLVSTAPANAATNIVTDPNGGGHTWSDCLYPNRSLASSEVIAKFSYASGKAAGSYVLDCGGVRHIKDTRGFDHDTETCINYILRKASKKGTSNTTPANDLTQRTWVSADGKNSMTGFVVTAKTGNHRIVTAYTNGSYGTSSGSAAWGECLKLLA